MQAQTESSASAMVMDLLARHVPLALLIDLAAADGPWSLEVYESERASGPRPQV